jgi:hypothetical protein
MSCTRTLSQQIRIWNEERTAHKTGNKISEFKTILQTKIVLYVSACGWCENLLKVLRACK